MSKSPTKKFILFLKRKQNRLSSIDSLIILLIREVFRFIYMQHRQHQICVEISIIHLFFFVNIDFHLSPANTNLWAIIARSEKFIEKYI